MRLLDGFSRTGAVRMTGAHSNMRCVLGLVTLLLTLVALGPATALASGVWSAPTKIASIGIPDYSSVSCSSATFCVAVGHNSFTMGGSYAITYNGTSWSAPTNIESGNGISSVSCPSATFCVAVNQNGNAITYNGTSWSAPSNIGAHPSPSGYQGIIFGLVSCPSATFCAAVGGNLGEDAFAYNGASWTELWAAPTNIEHDGALKLDGSLQSVSCASATFCAAVGETMPECSPTCKHGGGYAITYNGTSWSAPTKLGSWAGSVSCPSATFCVAVGGDDTMTYDGTSWSAAPTDHGIDVSCSSATFCAAVQNDWAETYNGTSWSAFTKIVPGPLSAISFNGPLSSVSCPSATFCVAVGFNDQGEIAVTYTTATAPKNTGLPIIKGKFKEKSKLTASNGTWIGATRAAYKYQWEVCNAKAKKCQAIQGATKNTFTITSKYVGSRMRVAVTATSSVGSARVLSKATPVIEK